MIPVPPPSELGSGLPHAALQSVVLPARRLTFLSLDRSQGEQATLSKEGIGAAPVIPSSPTAFLSATLSPDAAQPHAPAARISRSKIQRTGPSKPEGPSALVSSFINSTTGSLCCPCAETLITTTAASTGIVLALDSRLLTVSSKRASLNSEMSWRVWSLAARSAMISPHDATEFEPMSRAG